MSILSNRQTLNSYSHADRAGKLVTISDNNCLLKTLEKSKHFSFNASFVSDEYANHIPNPIPNLSTLR